jgi:diaminopimelate epimerase
MHGLGNDFVVFYEPNGERLKHDPRLMVQAICDRRRGIGADGVVVLGPAYTMEYYNADGSRAICGNAMRCAARYFYEQGVQEGGSAPRQFSLKVDTGLVPVEILDNAQVVRTVIGTVTFEGREIPTAQPGDSGERAIEVLGTTVLGTAVGVGNPHFVTVVSDVEAAPVDTLGAALEVHPFFPQRTNVEFIQVLDRGRLRMRVWERGVGETLACGTGAVCSVAAAVRKGLTAERVVVEMRGGEVVVDYDPETQRVALTGPATRVFEGVLWEVLGL